MKIFFSKILSLSILTVFNIFSMEQDQVWDGKYYHQNARPQFESAMKHINRLTLQRWPSILDVGCGAGDITAAIAERATESIVVGVDVSEDMIAAAREIHNAKSNLAFRVLDAQKLDYDKAFDGAVSFLTLHWVADKKAFFRSLYNSLKPNGEFLITVGTKNPEIEALKKKFFLSLLRDEKWKFLMKTDMVTANNAVSQDEFNEMALAAGFEDIEIEEQISSHDFSSKEELAGFFGSFASGYKDIAALPKETKDNFIKAAAYEWVKLFPEGNKITYMWANLVAKGKKPAK